MKQRRIFTPSPTQRSYGFGRMWACSCFLLPFEHAAGGIWLLSATTPLWRKAGFLICWIVWKERKKLSAQHRWRLLHRTARGLLLVPWRDWRILQRNFMKNGKETGVIGQESCLSSECMMWQSWTPWVLVTDGFRLWNSGMMMFPFGQDERAFSSLSAPMCTAIISAVLPAVWHGGVHWRLDRNCFCRNMAWTPGGKDFAAVRIW